MIPIVHQGLHIRALGQHGAADDTAEAPDFIAALAAQDGNPTTPNAAISAEAYIAAGMIRPDLPMTETQPILPVKSTPAPPFVSATLAAERSPSEPAFAPSLPAMSFVAASENSPQPKTLIAAETPTASASKQQLTAAAADSAQPFTSPQKSRNGGPAGSIAGPVNDITAMPTSSESAQSFCIVAGRPTDTPTGTLPKSADEVRAVAPQTVTPDINFALETLQQPSAKIVAIGQPAIAPPQDNPDAQPFHPRALLNPTADDSAFSQQALPSPNPPAQTMPDQIRSCHAEAAAPPQIPERHATSISAAESAWQTRLQVAEPLALPPKPNVAAFQTMRTTAPSSTDDPTSEITLSKADSTDLKALAPPNPDAPIADADRASGPHLARADQTTAQTAADLPSQQPNPPTLITPPHQAQQTQAPPPIPATPVSAQLLHHATSAKTGAVDVLLQPAELGHVKFQIQQHGDTVRILLSAERPETLDLLRRHSDQLLQEFRQSGFSQASLNFGQWGQQQRAPTPPSAFAAPPDADTAEAPPPQRHTPTAAAASSGQGLNLRL